MSISLQRRCVKSSPTSSLRLSWWYTTRTSAGLSLDLLDRCWSMSTFCLARSSVASLFSPLSMPCSSKSCRKETFAIFMLDWDSMPSPLLSVMAKRRRMAEHSTVWRHSWPINGRLWTKSFPWKVSWNLSIITYYPWNTQHSWFSGKWELLLLGVNSQLFNYCYPYLCWRIRRKGCVWA